MSATGEKAFAHTRLRAWRSRLLRRPDVMPLLAANDAASHGRALAAIGAATDGEALEHAFARLLEIYHIAIRGYRQHAMLFVALLRLHEVENLKLAWRATARHVADSRWHALWRSLGSLGAVTLERCASANSLGDLVERLQPSPYGSITGSLFRAHGDDIAAFELAIDRWASEQLLAEAAKLPEDEALSRAIIESLVHRRDAQVAERGEAMYGLSRQAVERPATSPGERRGAAVPYPTLLRRASRQGAFSLAPALAIVLLAEEELHGVIALTERRGRAEVDDAVVNMLEPSLMGPGA